MNGVSHAGQRLSEVVGRWRRAPTTASISCVEDSRDSGREQEAGRSRSRVAWIRGLVPGSRRGLLSRGRHGSLPVPLFLVLDVHQALDVLPSLSQPVEHELTAGVTTGWVRADEPGACPASSFPRPYGYEGASEGTSQKTYPCKAPFAPMVTDWLLRRCHTISTSESKPVALTFRVFRWVGLPFA